MNAATCHLTSFSSFDSFAIFIQPSTTLIGRSILGGDYPKIRDLLTGSLHSITSRFAVARCSSKIAAKLLPCHGYLLLRQSLNQASQSTIRTSNTLRSRRRHRVDMYYCLRSRTTSKRSLHSKQQSCVVMVGTGSTTRRITASYSVH